MKGRGRSDRSRLSYPDSARGAPQILAWKHIVPETTDAEGSRLPRRNIREPVVMSSARTSPPDLRALNSKDRPQPRRDAAKLNSPMPARFNRWTESHRLLQDGDARGDLD